MSRTSTPNLIPRRNLQLFDQPGHLQHHLRVQTRPKHHLCQHHTARLHLHLCHRHPARHHLHLPNRRPVPRWHHRSGRPDHHRSGRPDHLRPGRPDHLRAGGSDRLRSGWTAGSLRAGKFDRRWIRSAPEGSS